LACFGIAGAFLAWHGPRRATSWRTRSRNSWLEHFIPICFCAIGFLIDPVTFVHDIIEDFFLVGGGAGALLVGEWITMEGAGRAFGYTRDERLMVWSLTPP
jgi:hypothetical protein